MIQPIQPNQALYIKLGRNGCWERECIEEKQTLRIGFDEALHDLCMQGAWSRVLSEAWPTANKGTRTGWVNQTKLFYESGPDVLWITFYKNRLYWCFSERDITLRPDNGKERLVRDKWSYRDIKGAPLDMSRLSGKLCAMAGFRGTICSVTEFEYLVNKINAIDSREVAAARSERALLVAAMEPIDQHLHWRDFELLIDLIFRQAGWKRISQVGGPQKTLDLELQEPITDSHYSAQVKSQAGLEDFQNYESEMLGTQFHRGYFAVHTPTAALRRHSPSGDVELWHPARIAELVVKYGLVDWVIDKAG